MAGVANGPLRSEPVRAGAMLAAPREGREAKGSALGSSLSASPQDSASQAGSSRAAGTQPPLRLAARSVALSPPRPRPRARLVRFLCEDLRLSVGFRPPPARVARPCRRLPPRAVERFLLLRRRRTPRGRSPWQRFGRAPSAGADDPAAAWGREKVDWTLKTHEQLFPSVCAGAQPHFSSCWNWCKGWGRRWS